MPRRSTSRPAAPARTARRANARPTELSDVPIARRYVTYKYRWRLIDIRKLIGSRRCSGLTVEHQQQTQWCWAAVSNSVSHFYDAGSTWTQCAIVNAELGQTACCTNGSSSACNQPWYLDRALTRVGCLLSWASGTLTFATVKSLINSTRPPCARQGWSGGGGHFMAIVCYFEGLLGLLGGAGSTAKRLRISDPWYGDSVVDYDVFVSGYQGTGSWTHSYRTQP
jgi:hypothetical protein